MDPPEIKMKKLVDSSSAIPFNNKMPIRLYFRSAQEMIRMANVYRDEGDDERAFQLYFRLALEKMIKHPEYKEYDFGEKEKLKKQCKNIFPVTEELKAHIKKRYEFEYNKYLKHEEELRKEEDLRIQREEEAAIKEIESKRLREQQDLARKIEEAKERNIHGLCLLTLDNRKESEEKTMNGLQIEPSAPPSSPHPNLQQSSDVPNVDRTKKPTTSRDSDMTKQGWNVDGLRQIILPRDLIDEFLKAAKSNTSKNVETGGILTGKLAQNIFTITSVIIPKQEGCPDSFSTLREEEIFDYQTEHDLITLGWIHTHPSQSAFLSSVDLHTHCSYQLLLAEAIAIVVAPTYDEKKIFSLTSEVGLPLISNCPKTGFHPHPNDSTLYGLCSHVVLDDSRNLKTQLVDLRK